MSLLDRLVPPLGRRRAERELPQAAEKMGLQFNQGEYKSEIGSISGTYQEHEVLVRPDKPAIIVRYQKQIDGIDLSTWSPSGLRRPEINFDSGNREFDRLFKKRKVAKQLSEKFQAAPLVFEAIVAFRRKWRRVIAQIDLDTMRFSIWMKNRLAVSYVSAAEMEGMLPEMTNIVSAIENALR